jgi:hypothetical protein
MTIIQPVKAMIFLSGILFTLPSCNKEDLINSDQIKEFTISSGFTTSDYEIKVVLPKEYDPDKKYETVYVLDGLTSYLNYRDVAGITETKSTENTILPPVVVGIGGVQYRGRDFTPSTVNNDEGYGGIENYVKFIGSELIPRIEKEFAVDTTAESRLIIGHSMGGLCTGYLFTNHPDLFKNYLILSPSIWWDDGVLLDFEMANRESNSKDSTIVYIGCGEFEEGIVILAKEWYYRLATYYPDCQVTYKKLPNLAHVSSAMQNVSYGLEFYYGH